VIDWDAGRYETTAQELQPAAAEVIALAGVRPGERLLDLACGTGNAALLAARAGARVTGVDGAARLVDLARSRCQGEGFVADFVVADMHDLPLPSAAFDVVVSVFGLIFADDPPRALGELLRVLAPGGRAYVSAWLPGGTIGVAVRAMARAVAEATGRTRNAFPWHDRDALQELGAGAAVTMHERTLAITADSPEAYFRDHMGTHPASVAMRPVLERAGTYESALAEAQEIVRAANEAPDAFLISSRYVVAEIRR
jgi:SAM-dependent methyltransferase